MRNWLNQTWLRGSFLAPLALLAWTGSAHAENYLAAEPMTDAKIRIDGMLREWPGSFAKLAGPGGASSGNSALVGYDNANVYLAAKVKDANIVRTPGAGAGEDHLTLSLWVPNGKGGGATQEIAVYPGVPGKSAALVKVDGKVVSAAKAVEAPTADGLIIEASVPWAALSSARNMRVGMRGVISYHDASSVGRVSSVTSSGTGSGAQMPPLTIGPETGLIETLLIPKGLKLNPDREIYADVTGSGGAEKIALYGHFLSIVGPGYKSGKQFYFNELDVEDASQITRLEALDVNGDGRAEIVLQKRLGTRSEYREVLQILQIGSDGAPLLVFAHEVAMVSARGRIENKVSITGSGSAAQVTIAQGQASGFEPSSFSEPTIGGGVASALLPWQTIKSRTFAWKGAGLAQISEESWQPKVLAPSSAAASPAVPAPPPPRPPSAEEMLDRVYALYKQDRGVSTQAKPRFDFVTDVVEDGQMERVLVHDRDLVVFGKGFKKGLSYTYLTIGVKDAKDILSVTTRDLVGDGKAEIIVHAVLNAQASESLGGEVVGRQALFVYKVEGEALKRIFAAETGRSLHGNRILGAVAFVPRGASLDIETRPARAIGWDKKSYPFPEDRQPAGGLEPLLLPWGSVGPRLYRFDGAQYVLEE